MFKNPKAAIGAFLAGGVVVGGITFAGVAHGAGTSSTSTGQSDAQYMAKHAWVQSVTPNGTVATLSIPSGDRLTITSALGGVNGGAFIGCNLYATVNGTSVTYTVASDEDGYTYVAPGTPTLDYTTQSFQPIFVDTGTISCSGNSGTISLQGYLTPVPAG
jgi:hypothetical protein